MTFISWTPHCSRSDAIARELKGCSHMVYAGWLGSHPVTVWLKYLGQLVRTLRILFSERPTAVFVMTPPVFAVMTVYFYCLLRHVPYVIDAHTAAFLHPRWRYLQGLQRFLCRHAATTIVTNAYLAEQVQAGGGNASIIHDVPIMHETDEQFDIKGNFTVAVVCSLILN